MNLESQDFGSPEAIKDGKIIAWIEQNIGGAIVRYEKQERWRGGWWVDVRRDGELLKLYVREERQEEFPPWPLEHEAGILQVLGKHGVPAPTIFGICDDPHATIMENLPGGLDFSIVSAEEERAVLEDFAQAMAKMHAIDPHELVTLGLKMPETSEEISLGCFKLCEAMYLKGKKRPDPRIEFLRQWIYRNIPKHRNKVSVLAVDSGQFLFENGKVTGLYDFEYGCLGDPLIDLAFIPGRLATANVRDVRPFFDRYAELTGDNLELEVIGFHSVWWGVCTPLIITPNMHEPPSHATYFEYIGWYVSTILGCFTTLADMKGLDLGEEYAPSPPDPSRWAQLFDVMAARVPPPAEGEPYSASEMRRFMEMAKRLDAQREVEDEYRESVGKLVGKPVRDWREADAALEEFVLSAGPQNDDELIRLFHRWCQAQANTLLHGLTQLPEYGGNRLKFSQILKR